MLKKINRKKLKHGDVIEFYIQGLGYNYAKFVNVLQIFKSSSYPHALRIYKEVRKTKLEDVADLNRELLIAPIAISGGNGIIKVLNCEIIANEDFDKEEIILPDVKEGYPPFAGGYVEENYEKMEVLKNLGDVDDSFYAKPKNVKHLEWAGASNVEGIPFRIRLEQLKLHGKDIKKVDGLKDWLEENIYERAIRLPVYSKLKKNIRDFALKSK